MIDDNILVGVVIFLIIAIIYFGMYRNNYEQRFKYVHFRQPMKQMVPQWCHGGVSDKPSLQVSTPKEQTKLNQTTSQPIGDSGIQCPSLKTSILPQRTSDNIYKSAWNVLKSDPITDDSGRIQIKSTSELATPLNRELYRNCQCTYNSMPLMKHMMFARNSFS